MKYESDALFFKGKSNYSLEQSYDQIFYDISIKNKNYKFLTSFSLDNNPFTVKLIDYNKKKNQSGNVSIKGNYSIHI